MPVLARIFEEHKISTVIVTMMPDWCRRLGAPRALGVEHPFGQTMGPAGQRQRQRQVFRHALSILERAQRADHLEESPYDWPDPAARRTWHPDEPAPIVRQTIEQLKGRR